jgi:hypothetical protein
VRTIENSEFHLQEMNAAYFGITVANPSATTFFRNNFIRSQHTHAFGHIGVQLGQSETNASNIYGNRLQIRTSTDGVGGGSAEAALQVWGNANEINLLALGPGLKFGVKFEPGSADNTLYYTSLQASTPIANLGINNQTNSGPPSDLYGPLSASGASFSFAFGVGTSRLKQDSLSRPFRLESRAHLLDLLLASAYSDCSDDVDKDTAFADWNTELNDINQSPAEPLGKLPTFDPFAALVPTL